MEGLLAKIFADHGPLIQSIKGFEERLGQKEMAGQILQAYLENQIALIEAGTGIGKSLAYLIPAILWSLKRKERTVIATYTIALQEQLLNKDIPMVLKALDVDIKAVMIKGMGNYLCLRKLYEIEDREPEIETLYKWSEKTKEGSYSDLSFPITSQTWDRVSAESQSCSHSHCPHYKECFFFKARQEAESAQLLVVNHHILFADLLGKKEKAERSIIPSYQRAIVDEAHHLEEVALSAFAKRWDRLNIIRMLGRVYSEIHPERSRLLQIRAAIDDPISPLIPQLEIDLPAAKHTLLGKIEKAFQSLEAFCRVTYFSKESRWRLRLQQMEDPIMKHEVIPHFIEMIQCLKKFAQSLVALKGEIEKKLTNHALELNAIALRLQEQAEGMELFFKQDGRASRVQWVEMSFLGNNMTLVDADLDISSYLNNEFFTPLSSVALCSATLACDHSFKHIRASLGISEEHSVTENIYPSPFDYATNALLAIPTDLPEPNEASFTKQSVPYISRALEMSQGGAFILFTSYDMLKSTYEQLQSFGIEKGFHFLKQGDGSRPLLIEQFKKNKKSVLFGTDSFWEGVDIAGEALRLVIISKLPFKVPSDPMLQALSELLDKEGKNSFIEYQVPQAVMKFKQGFGRLIRTQKDKGVILCLDKRLYTKSYGKLFLSSLPSCKTLFGRGDEIFNEMSSMF